MPAVSVGYKALLINHSIYEVDFSRTYKRKLLEQGTDDKEFSIRFTIKENMIQTS